MKDKPADLMAIITMLLSFSERSAHSVAGGRPNSTWKNLRVRLTEQAGDSRGQHTESNAAYATEPRECSPRIVLRKFCA